jgi:hypothetical protein
MAQAARIAINRTVAGVHFPIDSAAGLVLGLTLAKWFVGCCKPGVDYGAWTFDGSQYQPADRDFYLSDFFAGGELKPFAAVATAGATATSQAALPSLGWLWQRAVAEWQVKTPAAQ